MSGVSLFILPFKSWKINIEREALKELIPII